MSGKLLSSEEIRLATMWYKDDDMTPGAIAKLLRRNKSTMTRLLVKQDERTGHGQPKSLCSAGHGKLLLWKIMDGRNWNGDVASEMYSGCIKDAVKSARPRNRCSLVLEDNDPSFTSRKGVQAKRAAKIVTFKIPRRSHGLNVCDYTLWHEINKRMRKTEAKWEMDRLDTRAQYFARLRRTAMRLPTSFIKRSIGDLRRRCARLYDACGGNFEEGGR